MKLEQHTMRRIGAYVANINDYAYWAYWNISGCLPYQK